MIAIHQHITVNARQYDPTHTTSLRNAFAREMVRRFEELVAVIRTAIVDQDCFGMRKTVIGSYQMDPPDNRAFAFARSADKVQAFMEWLKEQERKGLLTVGELTQIGAAVEGAWTNRYVFDSYKRGVVRARYELGKAGYKVPTIDQTGGIEISMATPFHLDRVGLLYSRTYEELKGVTSQMDTQISRVLAQGMADGDNPRLLARKLVATVNGDGVDRLGIKDSLGRFIPAERRAEMIARTEIIRAHHQATIQEYRNWGAEGVAVEAEWHTAGDSRVCEECAELEGHIFTLDEIEGMIPLHPQCRCNTLPVRVREWKKKRK